MSNAQTTRRRRPKPGDMAALQRTLWAAIRDVEDIVHGAEAATTDERLKAASTLATLGGTYMKAWEAAEVKPRLAELESYVEEIVAQNPQRLRLPQRRPS